MNVKKYIRALEKKLLKRSELEIVIAYLTLLG